MSNAPQLTNEEHAEFAQWFLINTDVPEGVDAFDCTEDGVYVWQEVRDGLARTR